MKNPVLILSLICLGFVAQASDCVVQDSQGAFYDITLSGDTVDVVTAGAGWLLTLDASQSSQKVKYYAYRNLVFLSESGTVSIYDYSSKIYYFRKQTCELPTAEITGYTASPETAPPGFKPHFQNLGAVGLSLGEQTAPLPVDTNGNHFDVKTNFTAKRNIRNPEHYGIACDFDKELRADFCTTRDFYIVAFADKVELTIQSTGIQYLLRRQKQKSCGEIGPFCETLYAVDGLGLKVGQGHTDGIQLYVVFNGSTQEFSYEYPWEGEE